MKVEKMAKQHSLDLSDALQLINPHFSHRLVTKRRKRRADKARDRGPRKRTVRYAEEADRAQRSQGE